MLLLTVIVWLSVGTCFEVPDYDALFDDGFVANFEKQWSELDAPSRASLMVKVGKLAFYARLYRQWIVTPTGEQGFLHRFPEPRVSVHADVVEKCRKTLVTCVDGLFLNVQQRNAFLFPLRNQTFDDFVLNEERFRNLVASSMFAYDVTVAYLMCFFTKNRLSLMRHLPFCEYGTEKFAVNDAMNESEIVSENAAWPSMRFRHPDQDPLAFFSFGDREPIGRVDMRDFVCADESFCPDPCCGRPKDRWQPCPHAMCREVDLRRRESPANAEEAPQHSCVVESVYNRNFAGIITNRWNVSCVCPEPGFEFRFDARQCVDLDECRFTECPAPYEECINLIGGFSCECMLGYRRNAVTGECERLPEPENRDRWLGIAHEPPSSANDLLVLDVVIAVLLAGSVRLLLLQP